MNRPWQVDVNAKLLERIRDQLPNAVLRTTLIVGYPGETDSQFEHLASFLQQQRFDHVGVFTFSAEEGTPAAALPDAVASEIAEARKDRLMSLQQPISAASNSRLIGQTVEVLIEQLQPETGQMIGRCARFAPEIDGEVQVSGGEAAVQASPGTMLPVRITGADIYDLTGEIAAAEPMVAAERTGS